MYKIEIKKHNFEVAKKRIGDFKLSNNGNYFARIKEKEFFGLFDRNVTGQEMNKHIDKVQNAFIGVNKYINDIVKEFNEIYNALNALDCEYIDGIIKSLEEAQRAIDQNKDTVNSLNASVLKLLEIEQNVEDLEKEIKREMANIENSNSQYISQLVSLKTKIESLEKTNNRLNENLKLLEASMTDKQTVKNDFGIFNSLYYKISIAIFAISSFTISLLLLNHTF